MNYFIKRELNEYGPYSLADLQKYVASGNILLTDLCRSEGLTDWVPVSQVIGNIPVPVAAPQPAAGTVYAAGTGASTYGGQAGYVAPVMQQYPPPPSLHWGICVLLAFLTCGIFSIVWIMVQAVWVKKVQPTTKAVTYFGIVIGLWLLSMTLAVSRGISAAQTGHADSSLATVQGLISLAYLIIWIIGSFNMRDSIEEHFNSAEPIGLSLSGVMTFFFNVFYFQYHFNRINEMKQRQMGGYPG